LYLQQQPSNEHTSLLLYLPLATKYRQKEQDFNNEQIRHNREKEQLTTTHNQDKEQLKAAHNQDKEQLKAAHNREKERLTTTHNQEKEQLKALHNQEKKQLINDYNELQSRLVEFIEVLDNADRLRKTLRSVPTKR
jgi:hypothetical protein